MLRGSRGAGEQVCPAMRGTTRTVMLAAPELTILIRETRVLTVRGRRMTGKFLSKQMLAEAADAVGAAASRDRLQSFAIKLLQDVGVQAVEADSLQSACVGEILARSKEVDQEWPLSNNAMYPCGRVVLRQGYPER